MVKQLQRAAATLPMVLGLALLALAPTLMAKQP